MDPAAFHARVLAAADERRRLPRVVDVPTVEIYPYEVAGLVPVAIDDLELPEPPRHGEDPAACACRAGVPARAVWADDGWYLTPLGDRSLPGVMLHPRRHADLDDLDDAEAAQLGVLTVRISRALQTIGGVGRVHVYRWGDGGAHLHVWFVARPAGVLQLRGSSLADWMELLPPMPDDELAAAHRSVAAELAAWRGTALGSAGGPAAPGEDVDPGAGP